MILRGASLVPKTLAVAIGSIAPFGIGTILTLSFMVLSCILALPADAAEHTLLLRFIDIPCPGHVVSILDAAHLVEGLEHAEVDYDSARGIFVYNSEVADSKKILDTLPRDCPTTVLYDGPSSAVIPFGD